MKITHTGLVNAAKAIQRTAQAVVVGDEIAVDLTLRNERRSICNGCEHRAGSQCSKCECIINLKTMMAAEQCPVGKW